jgi:hypothetical protein
MALVWDVEHILANALEFDDLNRRYHIAPSVVLHETPTLNAVRVVALGTAGVFGSTRNLQAVLITLSVLFQIFTVYTPALAGVTFESVKVLESGCEVKTTSSFLH